MCGACGCQPSIGTGQSPQEGFRRVPNDMVLIERDILSKNDRFARENRARLSAAGIFAVNLISSPGSGKTTLLVETMKALKASVSLGVIEGDQQTSLDADRIRATGVSAVQINTGTGCHLDAHMVGHALDDLSLDNGSILFIENVGNLVCPASFDLGEARKVALLSVTEGDDKPLKYPDVFAAASLMVLTKVDLLPHVRFDTGDCIANARAINPNIEVLEVSAQSGAGMAEWTHWLTTSARRSAAEAELATHA